MKPRAPVAINAHRHPYAMVSQGTTSGATTAPMLVPALKIPVANARSFLGHHSATALIDDGKLPDSPRPRAKRAAPKPNTELTSACPIAARLQTTTANENPLRTPSQSMIRPTTSKPIAYAVVKANTMLL